MLVESLVCSEMKVIKVLPIIFSTYLRYFPFFSSLYNFSLLSYMRSFNIFSDVICSTSERAQYYFISQLLCILRIFYVERLLQM